MKLIENLNYFIKVVGEGKEFHVHPTVNSVIKEKDMETISTICLWKMKRKKKAWNIKNAEIKQYPQPLLIL